MYASRIKRGWDCLVNPEVLDTTQGSMEESNQQM